MDELTLLYKQNIETTRGELRKWGCNSFVFADLYHEAFCNFIEKQNTGTIVIKYPQTYITNMCKYLWLKERNWHKVHELILEMDVYQDNEVETNDGILNLVIKHLKNLSASCQEILTLGSQGFSTQRIIRQLNLDSSRALKNKKFYCKEKLMDMVINDPLFNKLYE